MAKSKFYFVDNFLSGLGAAHNLFFDSIESKNSFIEQICLSATLIDGLLRLSLVMKQQLNTGKNIIDPKLLFQGKRQKKVYISERTIYARAISEKIITKAILQKLNTLYDQRNIIIHRYLISDIKTKDVILISMNYIELYSVILERHRRIHNLIVQNRIGIAQYFMENPSSEQIHEQIMKKHF